MEDREFARRLYNALGAERVAGWMDEPYPATGLRVSRSIREAISSASTMVVLLSPSASSSEWVNFELGVAQALNRPIIPVILPGHTFEDSVPEHLRDLQVLDCNRMPLREIAIRIEKAAGERGAHQGGD